jgi:DNA polymerase III subunit gamma/tau
MDADSLARRYRPANFRDIVGQRVPQRVLYRMVHEKRDGKNVPLAVPRVPAGLLFTGQHGAGKTSTARILAAALNCEHEDERPCGECPECKSVAAGTSQAVLEIDAASNGGVEQVRALRELVGYDSGSRYRVVILDEAHSMSRDAFNSLLKVLEEPPPFVVFILLTTERTRIPKTVASRCMEFPFAQIAPVHIAERLRFICTQEREDLPVEDELLAVIADRADGSLRDAVMELEQVLSLNVCNLAEYRRLRGDYDFAPYLLASMVQGNVAYLMQMLDELAARLGDYTLISGRFVECLCDLLVLHSGGVITAQGEPLRQRVALAQKMVSPDKLAACMRTFWELRMHRTSDQRADLKLAMALCAETLAPVRPMAATSAANGHGVMSAAQIAVAAGSR